MTIREKVTAFDVIAVPADNVSFLKKDKGHADITITIRDMPDDRGKQDEQLYVVKRPSSMDEHAFKIALLAAFRTATELSAPTTSSSRRNVPVVASTKHARVSGAGNTNTERLEKLKKTVLNDSEWLPAQEVSLRGSAGAQVKNPSSLPNRWKRSGKIFAITSEGKDLYPGYALDVGGQPLPLIKEIIALFGKSRTPWSLAVWFSSPNSWLGNKKPKDLLISSPEKVLEAALRAKEGPVHG